MKQELARALKIGEFIPVMKPSYATPSDVMEDHNSRTYADIKHDGYRVQIHKSAKGMKMFTANGNEYNYNCYPDLVSVVDNLPTGIFEAEVVGSGSNHKEVFDKVKQRFRRSGISAKSEEKYLSSGLINSVPLSLKIFDTLKFERRGMLYVPLSERREYTSKIDSPGISPAESELITCKEDLDARISKVFSAREEGLVCKNPDSLYKPGQTTGTDWVKFKRTEPLDLVIVGLYKNEKHNNDLPFTAVLCATYNHESNRYETIGKISVVRNGLANEISPLIADKVIPYRPSNVDFSEKLDSNSFARFVPTDYIHPQDSVVLEVKAMNINLASNWQTCGLSEDRAYSMRIGFAEQVRYDKNPNMATKTCAVAKLYELQKGD